MVGDNIKIECLEELEENTILKDVKEREKFYISNTICVNKARPILSDEEKKKYMDDYRNETKENYLKYQNHYYKNNKEKFTQYYKDNLDKIKNKQKDYYQQNKSKILDRQKNYYKSKKEDKKEE